ncbi:hypothetical protein OZN62_05065 [Aurantiacibacter sp. MUD11]|uniref:hypothetical protein n=1 Tax=Aurantiacibacter sp. MUD11 TaxID=3003265 RepID=UPI0022AA6BC4|nr:hypothetical protein [Aurantiacibacter sp. MUD11]WAT18944.1 hypothetical protein OZN62_05065 [Aurantiacibacter sp. MUD11]
MQRAPDKTLELLREVRQTYDRIVDDGCEIHDRLIRLNDQLIRLRFAGAALVDLVLPALEHLLVEGETAPQPDLTVCLWDEATTGVGMPASPWSTDDFTSRREIHGANGPGVKVAYDMYCGIFSVVSLDDGCAYWWISSPERLPAYERAAPLREILQAWSEHKRGVFVHAAAVGDTSGAILLVGKGGSGKSTTAMAAASAGLRLVGEDYCLLSYRDRTPMVHSLFASAKLTDHSLSMFPDWRQLQSIRCAMTATRL